MTNSVLVFGYGNPGQSGHIELAKPLSIAVTQNPRRAVAFTAELLTRCRPQLREIARNA
jgi:hypothetical protein